MGCVGGLHPTEVPPGLVKYRGRSPPCAHSSSDEDIKLCYSETYTNQLPETSTKRSPFLLLGGEGPVAMRAFPPGPLTMCPSLICSTWIKASKLMLNVYGGRKTAWLASSVAICAVTMWPGQVRGRG